MPEQVVELRRSGSTPKLDIRFGHDHWGKYRAIVWNPMGTNPEKVVEGTNVDEVPDRFPIGETAAELADRILTVETFVVSFDSTEGDPFTIGLRVLQGNKTAKGGNKPFDGNLGDGGIAARFARFRIKVVA